MRGHRLLGAALSALALGACGTSGGTSDAELTGLVVAERAPPARVDVARAARTPAALAAALALPWSRAAAELGDHRLTVRTTMAVKEASATLETLTDQTQLDLARDGEYHATYENSADYGREVVFTGGRLYLRPRYARWHGRAPQTDDEARDLRDEMVGALAAQLELYAHGVEVSDKGAVQLAGRAARRIEIKRAPAPRPAPRPRLAQHAWREGMTVEAASGDVVLDEATGLALGAQLDATVGFVREGKRLTMHLTLTQDVAVGPVQVVAPAADLVVVTPERRREVDERNYLLEGIAPPAGKGKVAVPPSAAATAPTPAATAPPARPDKATTTP